MTSREELTSLKVADLQELLASRSMDSSGKKSELVDRLWQQLQTEASVSEGAVESGVKPMLQSDSKPGSDVTMLLSRLRMMKERHYLEQENLRIKSRTEQLELEMQLNSLGLDVENDSRVRSFRIQAQQERKESQNPDVSAVVAAHIQKSLLPPTELTPFDGDIQSYRSFLRAFEARVESRTSDPNELLYYLLQFTRGRAKSLVNTCLHLGERGYEKARQLLDSRFGGSHALIDSYVTKIESWPRISPGDVDSLDRFVLFLIEIQNAMLDVPMTELQSPSFLRQVVSHLPVLLRDRWTREADSLMSRELGVVQLSDLVKFLEKELRILRNPVFGVGKVPVSQSSHFVHRSDSRPANSTQKVNATHVSEQRRSGCAHCSGPHFVGQCNELRFKPHEKRVSAVKGDSLCFGCLRRGHRIRFCRSRAKCQICHQMHPTLLHRASNSAQGVSRQQGDVNATAAAAPVGNSVPTGGQMSRENGASMVSARVDVKDGQGRTFMPVVPVRLRSSSGKEIVTNAFLDQGSSTSFITDRLADELDVARRPTTIRIDTVAKSSQELKSDYVEDVVIAPLAGANYYALPPLFTLASLPVTSKDKCSVDQAKRWEHLEGVDIQDVNAPVGLLIGGNVAELLMVREVKSPIAGEDGPHGVRVDLGWYIVGLSSQGLDGRPHLVNFLRKVESNGAGDDICAMFEKLYWGDFSDVSDDRDGMSVEDRLWLQKVKTTVRKDNEGHFEIALPKSEVGSIPDSFPVAEKRLQSLRKRFKRDPSMFESYKSVVHSLADDGYAVKVPPSELVSPASRDVWYLPHHAVESPGKLRVVFDCAARSGGVCLNDILQGGPHLGQPLTAVISRFREGRVAFACDIQAMYHRVHVPANDSDLLRFLWFKGDDIDSGEVEVWRMRSHIFGAVSSSSIACLALQLCAEEGKQQFPEAADVLLRKTYVDDALVAVDSVEKAVHLADDLKQLCKTGAFSLKKFVANSAGFLRSIPAEERGRGVKDLNLDKDDLGSNRTLGVEWSMDDDTFRFRFQDKMSPVTRRGILSTVSSIFDPIGFWAPISLSAKLLLQKLCVASCGWDEAIPPALADEWQTWLHQAEKLNGACLPRDISGPPGHVRSTELHVFVDASESAFSAVAYIRREIVTEGGEVRVFVRFLMGKSRVAPLRSVSVPKLELAGAVLGSQISQFLVRELDTSFDKVQLWTDSLVVLMMIRNKTTRFKTYVANRLALIHDVTEVSEWGYVPSAENPADVGSRGADVVKLGLWLQGPDFLVNDRSVWPVEPSERPTLPASEVKRSSPVASAVVEHQIDSFGVLASHFSSFYKLKVAVAWYKRFMTVLKNGEFRKHVQVRRRGLRPRRYQGRTYLTLADIGDAETDILRYAQSSLADFPREQVRDGPVKVTRSSPLVSLKPEFRDGLLVVGGRLEAARDIAVQARHPVILPRGHHVSRLIIREAHTAVGHEGKDHTLWRLREKYWVLGAGQDIRKMLRSCVICRKVNGRPLQQLMADLPEERVVPDTGAFEKISCDFFGPILVKSGRVERKCWALVSTCMTTRGVHIEVLETLRTDSLISAIRRVAARRGEIRQIRSDNGTNMCGADKELREALSELNADELRRAALPYGIEWLFNPPHGSHFSGSVERQIRSVRKVWRSMPFTRMLDRESLYTLICEIESILNGRPLTYVATDDSNIEPITPNHLLLLRGSMRPVPGVFDETESFSRRRWRYVQYLADQFWARWKQEYLPTLQARQKWRYDTRNLRVGDIVLLVDSDVPRGIWPLARVIEVRPSLDGRVRKALVKTSTSTYLRPIHKMVLIHSETDLVW